jgi:hypothetical protein
VTRLLRGPLSAARLPRGRTAALAAAALAAGILSAPLAQADVVHLRNGRTLEATGVERDGDHLRVRAAGGVLRLPADQVLRVEPSPPTPNRKPDPDLVRLRDLAAQVHGAFATGQATTCSRAPACGSQTLAPPTWRSPCAGTRPTLRC